MMNMNVANPTDALLEDLSEEMIIDQVGKAIDESLRHIEPARHPQIQADRRGQVRDCQFHHLFHPGRKRQRIHPSLPWRETNPHH